MASASSIHLKSIINYLPTSDAAGHYKVTITLHLFLFLLSYWNFLFGLWETIEMWKWGAQLMISPQFADFGFLFDDIWNLFPGLVMDRPIIVFLIGVLQGVTSKNFLVSFGFHKPPFWRCSQLMVSKKCSMDKEMDVSTSTLIDDVGKLTLLHA